MTRFSTHYLGSTLFSSLTKNLDYLIIGKLFTPTELGLYTLAFRLMDLPRIQLGLVIQSVMYPVFVHLQEDDDRTRAILYKICLAVSLLVFPVLIGLMVVAPDFILVVYGSKWLGATILLQLLVWAGMMSAVDLTPFVMYAQGKADWVFWMAVTKTSLLVVVILLGASQGLTIVAMLISVNRLTGFTFYQYFRSLSPAIFASILLGLTVWSVKNALIPFQVAPWIILVLQTAAGCIAFVIALFLWPGDDVRQLVIWGQSRIPVLENSRLVGRAIGYWGVLATKQRSWLG
jgi:PST family polysaccharide transporter